MNRREWDESFTEYVLARRSPLRRFAFTLTGEWAAAEDLLQIALTKLYVAWPRLREPGREDAYVRRILATTAVDESRRPWSRIRTVADPETLADRALPPVQDHADASPERLTVVAALQQLPTMQRRVVVLRHLADLSVAETADALDITPGTVKSHNARALARLGELLDTPLTTGDRP